MPVTNSAHPYMCSSRIIVCVCVCVILKATATADTTKEKKKRKRKPRLPKNYDPTNQPDLERWLPLRERSYYRRSRRKGVSATARGSQGIGAASAALMNQLDASKPSKTDAPGT